MPEQNFVEWNNNAGKLGGITMEKKTAAVYR
jgi:hypothetical protein